MDFKNKYLKYKNKYLALKKQLGGAKRSLEQLTPEKVLYDRFKDNDITIFERSKVKSLINLGFDLSLEEIDETFNNLRVSEADKKEKQKQDYIIKNEIIIEDNTKCKECGKILNAGTYGVIREKINDQNTDHERISDDRVIKITIEGHSITTGCPENFDKEYKMYNIIKNNFNNDDFNYIRMTNTYDSWVENRKCLIEMDKINPYQLSEIEKQYINEQLDNNLPIFDSYKEKINKINFSYMLNRLLQGELLMLVPGEDVDHFTSGGNKYSNWFEIGQNKIDQLFYFMKNINSDSIWDTGVFYNDLVNVLNFCKINKILLTDIEFIIGNTTIEDNKIFMIDFDKTHHYPDMHPLDFDSQLIDFYQSAPMFPNFIKFNNNEFTI
jgi:hypothetical protein